MRRLIASFDSDRNNTQLMHRTETLESLQQRLDHVASMDINFPFATENADKAEFPDQYILETETGLVPASSIRTLRELSSPTLTEDLERPRRKYNSSYLQLQILRIQGYE